MILRSTVVPGLAILVAIVTASVTLFLGIGAAPSVILGDPDVILLLPPGELVPGQGSVDTSLIEPLLAQESVRAVSPEIYAPTIIQGRSVLARGVSFPEFIGMEGARLEGRPALGPAEAVIGAELAASLGMGIGSEIVVPGAKSGALVRTSVVGVMASTGPTRDELFVTLDGARALVDMPSNAVHVVRIDARDPAAVISLVRGLGPTFTLSNVTISSDEPLLGERITVRARLTNWGLAKSMHEVVVRADHEVIAREDHSVPGRTSVDITIGVALPPHTRISQLTVNPTFDLQMRDGTWRIEAHGRLIQGENATFKIMDQQGVAVPGVEVELGTERTTTDADGWAFLTPMFNGTGQVKTRLEGRTMGILNVAVALPGTDNEAAARVERIDVDHVGGLVRADAPVRAKVTMINVGGMTGTLAAPVLVDGIVVGRAEVHAQPGQRVEVDVSLPPLAAGDHLVTIGGSTISVEAVPGDPAVEAILRRYDAVAHGGSTGVSIGGPQIDYVEKVAGEVRTVILTLSLATGALAATAGIAVIARHVDERSRIVGTLKALGASDDQVHEIAARDAFVLGALAAGTGIGAGVLLSKLVEGTRLLHAYGHQVHPLLPWHVLALIFVVSTLFVLLTTRVYLQGLLRRDPTLPW